MIRGTDDRERVATPAAHGVPRGGGRLARAIALSSMVLAGFHSPASTAQEGPGSPPPRLPGGAGAPEAGRQVDPPALPGLPETPQDEHAPADGIRYRLVERYTTEDAVPSDGRIGAYRVAYWEVNRSMIESSRGAPERTDTTVLVKTTERPALLGGIDESTVLGLVRRYDTVQFRPDPRKLPSEPPRLTGRTLWIEQNRRGFPLVLTMTEVERPLLEDEFRFAAFQTPFLPDLVDLLPEIPTPVGGTWEIPVDGAEALLGSTVVRGALTGKLLRVAPATTPGRSRATCSVTGRVQFRQSLAAVNAEFEFEFTTPEQTPAPGSLLNARGATVRLGMTLREVAQVPREGRAANATRTRQIVLERRLAAPGDEVPDVPVPTPTKSVQNSWVRSISPDGRFRFDHPQDFLPGPLSAGETGVHLMRDTPAGPDDLLIEVVATDRSAEDKMVQTLVSGWSTAGVTATKGAADWLPEADWPGMRVYRAEFTLTSSLPPAVGEAPQRAHMEAYQIRFQRDATAYVKVITPGTDPEPMRREIEEIIRTLALGATPEPAPAPEPAPEPSPAP